MDRSLVRLKVYGVLAACALALAACGDDSPTAPSGGGGGGGGGGAVLTTSVNVNDDFFSPGAIQVSPGATVTWTWVGSNPHNVSFTDPSITDSGTQTTGMHSTTMPTSPGTYNYQCTIHSGMSGTVLVQ